MAARQNTPPSVKRRASQPSRFSARWARYWRARAERDRANAELQHRIAELTRREQREIEQWEAEQAAREHAMVLVESREQREVEAYTERWHRVNDWAEAALMEQPQFEPSGIAPPKETRVAVHSYSCVRDLDDPEEAFTDGKPLSELDWSMNGPRRELGGIRRCMVTARVWTIDRDNESAYDPSWITIGWGMTAHECCAAVRRYVRAYSEALAQDMVSREQVYTVLETKWWTAREASLYV